MSAAIRALWPTPGTRSMDDAELIDHYVGPARTAPWLRLNFVTSVDGAVTVDGYSEGLSGVADKRVFGLLRMLCDALLVGAGTLRNEGYGPVRLSPERRAWRTAHGLREYPTLVVLSRRLDLDPADPALADAPVRPIVLTHAGAPAPQRAALGAVADVVTCGTDEVDLTAARTALADRGLRHVLSEGGPHVLGTLTSADLVDEVCLTISPMLAGPGAGRITAGLPPPAALQMRLAHVLLAPDALLLRYVRAAPPGPATAGQPDPATAGQPG